MHEVASLQVNLTVDVSEAKPTVTPIFRGVCVWGGGCPKRWHF